MKIKAIGVGNAFSQFNFNQSFLLEENDKKLLIDCGSQIPQALKHNAIDMKDITDVYISHQHADHIGGLEHMAFYRYDWMNRPQHYTEGNYAPNLIANEKLMTDLWDCSLKGGLESMEGFVATLETYFEPIRVKTNETVKWEGWNIELVQQIHIMTGSTIMNTFGLFISKPGHKSVYFTTDAQHCSPRQVEIFYKKADLIFQDCECTPFMSGVHANYKQLAGYPDANSQVLSDDIKEKMWLSHYQDFVTLNMTFDGKSECKWQELAKKDGFAGFAVVGQEWNI